MEYTFRGYIFKNGTPFEINREVVVSGHEEAERVISGAFRNYLYELRPVRRKEKKDGV